MNLPQRISLLEKLGNYMRSQDTDWLDAKKRASLENGWFVPSFIDSAINQIAENWLHQKALEEWTTNENVSIENSKPKKIGLVLAGNIPLVGFHDWLSVFITGNYSLIKTSSKDRILLEHLAGKMIQWEPSLQNEMNFADRLTGCDGYIATGSNNSSRYFEYYFSKYPHLIRKNKTSAAILTGKETREDLEKLAEDVHLYFGLGCRNVTKIYVPTQYDFIPLLEAFKKFSWLSDNHKFKNNYDYNLALYILNKKYYMTNGTVLLIEDASLFAPVTQLNYEFYTDKNALVGSLSNHPDLQCLVGNDNPLIPFGKSQSPALADYADGSNTLAFLNKKMLN